MNESTSPRQYLEQQHRDIDAGLAPIAAGAMGDAAALAQSLALLRHHLYLEEELLFPVLEHTGLTMPIFVMKREHGQMWPLLQELAGALDAGQPVESLQESCAELFKLLQIHNPKEEQIVYAAADRVAQAGEGEPMVATLDAADAPDDWVCAMAPR